MAKDPGIMSMKRVFRAEAIGKNGTADSIAFELQGRTMLGIFSILVTSAGSGTLTFTYKLSYDNIVYLTPDSAITIKTGHTAGTDLYSFAPELAPFIKITATEQNVNTISSLDVDICTQ